MEIMQIAIKGTYRTLFPLHRLLKRNLLHRYLQVPGTKKLHIGCAGHLIEGWLNCDLPHPRHIIRGAPIYPLDATRRFPFANDTFDAVFSEHMIEHISYDEGLRMLAECYRVLKRGQYIRVVTPNLNFLVELYAPEKTDLQKEYITWSADRYLDGRYPFDAFVINNFFYNWGHTFIYDEATLRRSMIHAGFVHVTSQRIGESPHSDFKNLENDGRMPPYFLHLESIVLEGMKPN